MNGNLLFLDNVKVLIFIGAVVLLLFGVIYCFAFNKASTTPKGDIENSKFRRKSTGITIFEDEKKVRDLSKSEMEVFVSMLEEYDWATETQVLDMNEKYNITVDFNNLSDTKLYLSGEIPKKSQKYPNHY